MRSSCYFRRVPPGTLLTETTINPEQRRERGMMLLVEGEMAAAIGRPRACRRREHGAAAQVHDLDRRGEKDAASPGSNGGAEIDVLRVHEVALVEQTDRFRIRPANEKTRAADPVGKLLPARHLFDALRGRRVPPLVRAQKAPLAHLVERRD